MYKPCPAEQNDSKLNIVASNKESCVLFSIQKGHEIDILDATLSLMTHWSSIGLYMKLLKTMFSNFMQFFDNRL